MLQSTEEGQLPQSEARSFQREKAPELSINEEEKLARKMRRGDDGGIGHRNT